MKPQRIDYLRLCLGLFCALSITSLYWATASAGAECLIPPSFDPGIGGVYFCPPAEGERYLIAHARRAHTDTGLSEDIWANFRGVFGNHMWVNIGMHEASDASLPAWDALASLLEWMQAIKAGNAEALEAFLAPLEINPTYNEADLALQQRLLTALSISARKPTDMTLRVVLYHVHLMPPRELQQRLSTPLNASLSLPSQEDLLHTPQLLRLAPESESKIAVPAGIWTYTWDRSRAMRFVSKYYDGPAETPFAVKYGHVYTRFATQEYIKQGLNDPAALTPERLRHYAETLRPTGAILHFAFATDWAAVQQVRAPE